jgi:hypothetical protein
VVEREDARPDNYRAREVNGHFERMV